MGKSVYRTEFPGLPEPRRGKVRDIYELSDSILMVATDRLSAFDVVMADPVPDKGKVLNQISLFWFDHFKNLVKNHIITADVKAFPAACKPYAEELEGRSVLVKKAKPLAIECVVRGYLSGSGWKSYKQDGKVCGIKLPEGLRESSRLPEPIFTPSTKAEQGLHDENISFEQAAELVGEQTALQVRELSLALYKQGSAYAETKGIIIADTKFEFGIMGRELILIDEVLTPDSSRFWPRESYAPGRGQDSYDKQYVRDWLESIHWNKKPPAPKLPENIIAGTREKYLQALSTLTGKTI